MYKGMIRGKCEIAATLSHSVNALSIANRDIMLHPHTHRLIWYTTLVDTVGVYN
jgi:hypothetical protein